MQQRGVWCFQPRLVARRTRNPTALTRALRVRLPLTRSRNPTAPTRGPEIPHLTGQRLSGCPLVSTLPLLNPAPGLLPVHGVCVQT